MIDNILEFAGLWLLKKIAELVLKKLLEKLLSEDNLKQLGSYLKLQIIVLYLDWLLEKTPVRHLRAQHKE